MLVYFPTQNNDFHINLAQDEWILGENTKCWLKLPLQSAWFLHSCFSTDYKSSWCKYHVKIILLFWLNIYFLVGMRHGWSWFVGKCPAACQPASQPASHRHRCSMRRLNKHENIIRVVSGRVGMPVLRFYACHSTRRRMKMKTLEKYERQMMENWAHYGKKTIRKIRQIRSLWRA